LSVRRSLEAFERWSGLRVPAAVRAQPGLLTLGRAPEAQLSRYRAEPLFDRPEPLSSVADDEDPAAWLVDPDDPDPALLR
jgi:hypothetical protein